MYRVSASIHDIAKRRAADTCGIPSRRSIHMRRILTTFAARPAHPAPAFARYRAYRSIDSPSGFRHEDLKDHLRARRVCYRSLRPCSGPRRFVDGESRCRRHDPMDTGHRDADGKDTFRSTANCSEGTLSFEPSAGEPLRVTFPLPENADVSCASGMPPLIEQFRLLCPQAAREFHLMDDE